MNLEKKFFSKIQLSPTYALWNEPQIYSLNNCILDRNSFRIHVCFRLSVSWKRNKYIRYLKACSRAESSQTGQIGFTSPLSDDLYVYIPVNVSALIGILCLLDKLVSANNAYGPNANDRQQFSLTFKKDRCIRC